MISSYRPFVFIRNDVRWWCALFTMLLLLFCAFHLFSCVYVIYGEAMQRKERISDNQKPTYKSKLIAYARYDAHTHFALISNNKINESNRLMSYCKLNLFAKTFPQSFCALAVVFFLVCVPHLIHVWGRSAWTRFRIFFSSIRLFDSFDLWFFH